MRQLRSKRVLITGAAQGIGRELALAFAREGAHVLLTDINADLLTEALAAVRATGAQVSAFPLDVTNEPAIRDLRERINRELGPIDVLVNNAGVVFGGAFTDVPLSRHRTTYEVNTLGMVAMTHAFLPDLIARPEAHLVNIASASAYIGLPYGSTYASSKWAALGFSESIRMELADQGHRHVHVTSVCPSYVATGLFAGAKPPRTTRFMETPELARQTVRAVQRNKVFLIRPRTVYLTPFFNGFLPVWLLDRVARWFGVNTSMLSWRGRTAPATAVQPPTSAPAPEAVSTRP
jgi:short-subunit dehydrogenase